MQQLKLTQGISVSPSQSQSLSPSKSSTEHESDKAKATIIPITVVLFGILGIVSMIGLGMICIFVFLLNLIYKCFYICNEIFRV